MVKIKTSIQLILNLLDQFTCQFLKEYQSMFPTLFPMLFHNTSGFQYLNHIHNILGFSIQLKFQFTKSYLK
ncbi:unnamed protein product [Chironomus riparius]|uniref:Uncharacterized protein n=1 Tax=Chironomus riparius TaxID=315576 RepID=A0A9N9WVW7_9DIPT|nr:unnamed protein product [Chironomus riparius]